MPAVKAADRSAIIYLDEYRCGTTRGRVSAAGVGGSDVAGDRTLLGRHAQPRDHRPDHRPAAPAAGARGLAAVGPRAALARHRDLPGHVHPDRARRDRGLSPPAHASQLQDVALDARIAGRPGHDGDRGPRDLVGRRPSQAPRLLRPPRRPPQPARRPRRRACEERCAALLTPTWGGCSTTPSVARANASPPT